MDQMTAEQRPSFRAVKPAARRLSPFEVPSRYARRNYRFRTLARQRAAASALRVVHNLDDFPRALAPLHGVRNTLR